MRFTLRKKERISSRNQIEKLFSTGQSFHNSLFKVVYISDHVSCGSIQVLFSVPKRRFKKAVHRNRIKRLMREAYRLNKAMLTEKVVTSTLCLYIGFIYIGNEANISISEISESMIQGLDKMKRML